jgi:molybdopterin converting factor small subunit
VSGSSLRVRLFASLRELAGSSEVEVEVPPGATAGGLIDALAARYGDRFAEVARAGSVVVDGERAGPDDPIPAAPGEVAVLPPVSGGGPG